ncbi:hypothetical protein ILYODFUR_011041 [Ilyodon furcidens]|uniref:Fibronectin type-III domain-containing protein n=1 Tax=Ilyodon furcidens TaxID=33524 RepID=A0ABV0UQX9_9TELE
MINSDHWIGLRKYINYNGTYNDTTEPDNSTNTSPNISDTPWTLWANGDPLVFQNWYPGYPVFKSPLPKIDCCSCSCTCPAPIRTTTNPPTVSSVTSQKNGNPTGPNISTVIYDNMTDFTSLLEFENATTGTMNFTNKANVTQSWKSTAVLNVHATGSSWTTTPQLPILSTCERSPMLPPVIPENNKNYIENSCVVILRFGPWVEKVCSEQKPFICYEDRFMGRVSVSNITSSSGSLQWDQGPGDLSHYRLQVAAANWNLTVELHNLNFELNNLTAGTRYNIQVFPVKCKRDLNPQNSSFYTIPGEVENLTVTSFTETSVSLSWKKPDGNYDFFQVTANSSSDRPIIRDNITTEHLVFDKLIQGNNYTFILITGVKDRTMWSQERNTLACTSKFTSKFTQMIGFYAGYASV